MAQSVVIHGVVTDQSGTPLPGANVSAASLDSVRSATSDIDGRYVLEGVPSGSVELTFDYPGYGRLRMGRLLERDTVRVDAELKFWCMDIAMVARTSGSLHESLGWTDMTMGATGAGTAFGADRFIRTEPGTDLFGRWRAGAPGAPHASYVNGVRALSLDDVSAQTLVGGDVYVGYVPAQYGGSVSGVQAAHVYHPVEIVADTLFLARPVQVGGTRVGPVGTFETSVGRVLEGGDCGYVPSFVDMAAEASLSAASGAPTLSGRGGGWYERQTVSASGRFGAATRPGSGAGVQASLLIDKPVTRVADSQRLTMAASAIRTAAGQATLVAGRWGRTERHDRWTWGFEASHVRAWSDASARSEQHVALHAEQRFELVPTHRGGGRTTPAIRAGLRAESVRASAAGTRRIHVSLLPRVLFTSGDASDGGRAHVYAASTAGTDPGVGTAMRRRHELGAGLFRSFEALHLGGQAWTNRSTGGAESADLVGAMAEVGVRLRRGHLNGRARREWGDVRLARNRWQVDARVPLPGHPFLRSLANHLRVAFDVSEGVSQDDGTRPSVSWLSVHVEDGSGRLVLGIEAVTSGRDALPCVDPVGAVGQTSCPTPEARVLVKALL